MKLVLETPSKLRISDIVEADIFRLKELLKYKDKVIEREIRNLKTNPYYTNRFGEEFVLEQTEKLKEDLWKYLLYQDEAGYHTLPGLKDRILSEYNNVQFENHVEYPSFQLIPWDNKPLFEPYPYQQEAVDAMLNNNHSHISLATGTGKSHCCAMLVKATGLPTVISTPSQSIAKQMYADLVHLFGKKFVGLYGAGKKEVGKRILVAVGKSLSLVQDPELLEQFKQYQVLISDESHTLPAKQFDYFVNKVLSHCPYRWFVSATQERNDGKDLLLEGIIGPIVYEKSIQSATSEGYLAKLSFMIFDVNSDDEYMNVHNIVKMNQKHLYKNKNVLGLILKVVPQALAAGLPTLILIDQYEQEELLRPYLGAQYAFAHGGTDNSQIVKDFNSGKIMCIVGTSAISTGTNMKPLQFTVNWCANKAGSKVKQGAIGRSTRIDKASGKTSCKVIDFRICNVPTLFRHANERIKQYKAVGQVTYADMTNGK